MIEDYKAARKMAEDAVRKAVRSGTSPYLPVLDALEEVRSSAPQTRLGVLELPLSRIKGNKRVSVSHFGGTEYIMADVIRILPEKNDSKESRVYYEYLDFYKVTQNYLIVFTEPGSYDKLAKITTWAHPSSTGVSSTPGSCSPCFPEDGTGRP